MKEVDDNYKLIKRRKQERIASIVTAISFVLIALICFTGLFLKNRVNENFIALCVILICIPLTISNYILYKSFYPKAENVPQPLFIPKVYGLGITINPNHPVGKFLWILVGIVI
ncbi:hypothetical protein ACVPPR_05710 [Dellaglioa sp. L3N]